jgi:voltage-gated potassium channel Kch
MKSNDEFIFMDIIDKNITPKDGDILKTIFVNNKVSNTTFKNMTFKECDFYGNFFYGCSFENVVFEDSIFFSDYDFFSVFENCKFNGCIFKKCNMEKIIITKCSLENIRYILCDLKNMIFNEIVAKKIYISDCDIRGGKILNAQIDILKFEDEYITKMDENTFISVKNDFKEVYKIYREISIKFESNRLANRAGEYYYIYKILERKDLSKIDKLKSYIYWMLCGYGERPTYALITSAEIILIFTIIYMFTGLSVGVSTIKYDILIFRSLPNDELLFDFLKSLYFSIVTFTTVGYGDVTPTGISLFL